MRIGIVADIHDAAKPLKKALALLHKQGVGQVVTLGDAFDTYQRGEPGVRVAKLLQEAGAVGVWGNHDMGLSYNVTEQVREMADRTLLAFAARLRPQLVLGGCRFSHVEPWKDPCRVLDLWQFDGVPSTREEALRCFRAVPERVLFLGHFHSWAALRGDGPVEWDPVAALTLDKRDRYLVLVPAVADGWCAMFDTETSELTPMRCSA